MADQVVIDRDHLDILLRRSSEYAALSRALMKLGVDAQKVESLVQRELSLEQTLPDASEAGVLPTISVPSPFPVVMNLFQPKPTNVSPGKPPPAHCLVQSTPHHYIPYHGSFQQIVQPATTQPIPYQQTVQTQSVVDKDVDLDETSESMASNVAEAGWQQVADRTTEHRPKRSLIFKNLPREATLKDIANVLRGGKILDMFISTKENQALVSFVEPSTAKAFLKWTEMNPVKIKGKKVSVMLDEKSFTIPKHVEQSIAQGVTRNILLSGMGADFNEQLIRDDLEHIHKLAIVEFDRPRNGKDIVISLNSIRLALYARTCMRSRAIYKKARITFVPDKCAAIPIPSMQNRRTKAQHGNSGNRTGPENDLPSLNRFDALSVFDSEA